MTCSPAGQGSRPQGRADARAGPGDPAGRPTSGPTGSSGGRSAGSGPRSSTPTARRPASSAGPPPGTSASRRSSTRSTACRSARRNPLAEEPALHRPGALGGPALPRDRRGLRRDGRAGPGRGGGPARAVLDGLQRDGRRRLPQPASIPRRGPPRTRPGPRRGRLRDRRPLFERKGHDDILAAAPASSGPTPRSGSSSSATASSATGLIRRRRSARGWPRGPVHRPGPAGTGSPSCSGRSTPWSTRASAKGLARVLPQALLVGRPVISYDVDGAKGGRPPRDRHPAPAPVDRGPEGRDPPAGGRSRLCATSMGREGRSPVRPTSSATRR